MSETRECESGSREPSDKNVASSTIAPDPKAAARRWLLQIRLAASFLTILPVGPVEPVTAEDLAGSFGWFPLVGFAIGLILAAGDLAFARCAPPLEAILLVTLLTVLTGALHLDALADAADAIGAGHDRPRALEIMRDSRIGSFGTVALILVIAIKVAAISSADAARRDAMLYLAPGLGRWTMVMVASGLEYLRSDGAGAAMLSSGRRRNLLLSTAITIVASAPLLWCQALRAALTAAAAAILMRILLRWWMGGVTGDLIGAAGEIAETSVLVAMSL